MVLRPSKNFFEQNVFAGKRHIRNGSCIGIDTHGNIPQNRERIFIVGFREKKQYENFSFPVEVPLKTQIKDLVDFQKPQEKQFYYSTDNHGYYDKLTQEITQEGIIYQ